MGLPGITRDTLCDGVVLSLYCVVLCGVHYIKCRQVCMTVRYLIVAIILLLFMYGCVFNPKRAGLFCLSQVGGGGGGQIPPPSDLC